MYVMYVFLCVRWYRCTRFFFQERQVNRDNQVDFLYKDKRKDDTLGSAVSVTVSVEQFLCMYVH